MLIGLNTYNSNARFGQLSTAAAREMYGGLKRIVSTPSEIGRLHKFDTGYIRRDTIPGDIREVAQHLRDVDGKTWNDVALVLDKTADFLVEYSKKQFKK